ncbi:pyruvate dehydrogenase complex dihydrolipoamide acetyltransferase [Aureibaculum sp. 2210JD6-5]|uniref:pyruvate dehydrogenase complex dihydrolipoamide acetyltransferase n=1 Tax=Aureibaculum sp. 2210JD6-5 TaxID=3103957 RepID=UPI002AAE6939|nr:pyruvate dehydrogenase complex dihydrolipoamide acetyltransferase [Aureibaculum sp. 2210JD6-5]MDY7394339.1 pyruvate dehydrogenase complex dihydrolipoamide acetyltransferase [Aureibaculum sp. 2210JD6-5]
MAEIINMPRLSDTMEEGVVAKWLKKVGDKINEGDILAEIETDKATMEFESFHEGTLLHIGIQEGETSKVDTLLAIIGEEGEDISDLLNGAKEEPKEDKNEETKEEKTETKEESKSSADATIPDGAEIITMPRLSDTMTEGTVATWLKKEGDSVKEGDILAEIETDKATMEFESFYEGTLLYIGVKEGETAAVDSVLAVVGEKGTDVSSLIASIKDGAFSKGDDKKAEKPATKKEEPKSQPQQTQKTETATKQEANVTTSESGGRIIASPLAKKIAKEKGINLAQVKGSGTGGRIIKNDVENFTPGQAGSAAMPFVPSGQENFDEIPNSQMRKVIARRLGESKFTAPHYYLNVEFNMDNAIAFRQQFNSVPDTKISYNDMVVKAVALALKQHPQVNSQWFDDKMRINHHVHIGVAVAVEDGLLVPVLKFADEQSLQQIGAKVKEYAGKARNKKLTPQEMEGSTFTISNLGMFGITDFTSIINQPNSAILSVGAIVQKPIVKEGQIVVGNTMKLTLACDHRTVDGATGAEFLLTLKGYIENPVTMLV